MGTTVDRRALLVIAVNVVVVGAALKGHLIEALLLLAALPVLVALTRRPQLGLILLVAVAPLYGLLQIIPHPGIVAGYKEGILVFSLFATFVSPPRRGGRSRVGSSRCRCCSSSRSSR
jgi:hypothetical protein